MHTVTPGIHEILKSVFGYSSFRGPQQEVVQTLIEGQDALVLMPTGGGKSLCFQIPALIRPGVAVVVSPLISLMKDQVDALRENGVRAACLNSSLEMAERARVHGALREGTLDLLYVAPERLMMPEFLASLDGLRIALFAIDEAHCVSQWGHDFRPEYVALGELRGRFPGVPMAAFTATADSHTREDIVERLHLEGARRFISSFDRPNIRYLVADKKHPKRQLQLFLRRFPRESGIVYCLSRKRVEAVRDDLVRQGIDAMAYHAGLPAEERSRVQERFTNDDTRVIVATVAFGMGIDKPNVRFVVHYDIPHNIESYYQETGRVGRDGLPSEALLLFGYQDVAIARMLIEQSENPEQVRIKLHKLGTMVAFAEPLGCRRRALLAYFGEYRGEDCGNCDVCLDPPVTEPATEEARKALSAVYRLREGFGLNHVVDVLRGAENRRIHELGHDGLSVYGIGKDRSRDYWIALIRQLIHHGLVVQDVGAWSVLRLTESSRPLLRGEVDFSVVRRQEVEATRPRRSRKSRDVPEDDGLFERLRRVRKQLADKQRRPPFVIFSDATLVEMVRFLPQDEAAFLAISGVGLSKLKRYGKHFLPVIREHVGEREG